MTHACGACGDGAKPGICPICQEGAPGPVTELAARRRATRAYASALESAVRELAVGRPAA